MYTQFSRLECTYIVSVQVFPLTQLCKSNFQNSSHQMSCNLSGNPDQSPTVERKQGNVSFPFVQAVPSANRFHPEY
jgi:hypothetical protein